MAVPEPITELGPLLDVWRAHDDAFEHVTPTWWGAVVSDRRYPAINEANYARVEARRPVRLAAIEAEQLPAGRRSHVVVFHPEDQTDLLSEVGTRGERIVWDLVMVHRGPAPDRGAAEPVTDARTEEVRRFDEAFWLAHAESTRLFDVEDRETLEQLQALERETMIPFGRRWFTVRRDGGPVAFASLLVADGTAFLDHVVTVPEARRRGYAEALTRRTLSEAAAAGATSTFLLADPGGRAERIYRRIGFEPVAHLASWTSERRR